MSDTNTIPEGRVQPIREFTAQVRRGETQIVGTAFAVEREPALLVTCQHVVKAATGHCKNGAEVRIYFPRLRDNQNKLFTATVHQLPDDGEDDVVLLKLDAERLPSGVEIAILGDAKRSVGYPEPHRFRSFGFRRLDKYQGLPALGEIIEFTNKPVGKILIGDPVMLQSQHIDGGMSGAPVLDLHRNLVVGVVSETWEARKSTDSQTNFAVDGQVLSVAPLNLELFDGYQLPTTSDLPVDAQAQKSAENFAPSINFPLPPTYRPTRPPELPEWAGREQLLTKLDQDYIDETIHITGLIGFGGEGKSSIAYRWLNYHALTGPNQPDAAFWWSFYEDRSFESMVEALTAYLYGEQSLEQIRGTGQRVNYIGAMALIHRVVVVLDGFEVMQEEEGDKYGNISNQDLLRLLELFGQTRQSYCLVTSRVPLMDFLNHTAYVQRDVTRLSKEDGRDLLRNLHIEGDNDTLDRIINDWEGHALTVSLVGSYLREREIPAADYSIDLFPQIEAFEDEVPRYRQVRRILQRYDEKLTPPDKNFLKLFSVFRLPVAESAFARVFRTDTGSTLNTELHELDDVQFAALVDGLEKRRLLKRTAGDETTYSAHPLVQHHYRQALEAEHSDADVQPIHKATAEHYFNVGNNLDRNPTLDDLKPYIEVVHHLCRGGAYDRAWEEFWVRINQKERYILSSVLGAEETTLGLMVEFFPNRDTTTEPLVSNPNFQHYILNEVGISLTNLGRLREAAPFYERYVSATINADDHENASVGYKNLANHYLHLGELARMQDAADKSLHEAKLLVDDQHRLKDESASLVYVAWATHLIGHISEANKVFKMAEELSRNRWGKSHGVHFLFSIGGIYYADHLRRMGDHHYARSLTLDNLKYSKNSYSINDIILTLRVLGDLEADAGNHDAAHDHYEQAITIAGQIDRVDVKIEALLARGRWFAKHQHNATAALADLDTALNMALKGEYRLYEADIRIARAWAHKAQGNRQQLEREASQALGMCISMGYHWGQVDAKEVLES